MYIPKSKIETNLFSSGELVIASTGEVYYGPYFKTFQGILYSGKEPNDGPNFILSTAPEESPDYPGLIDYRFNSKNSTYSNLTKVSRDSRPPLPIPFNPQPKDGDYQTGEITRFFAKKLTVKSIVFLARSGDPPTVTPFRPQFLAIVLTNFLHPSFVDTLYFGLNSNPASSVYSFPQSPNVDELGFFFGGELLLKP